MSTAQYKALRSPIEVIRGVHFFFKNDPDSARESTLHPLEHRLWECRRHTGLTVSPNKVWCRFGQPPPPSPTDLPKRPIPYHRKKKNQRLRVRPPVRWTRAGAAATPPVSCGRPAEERRWRSVVLVSGCCWGVRRSVGGEAKPNGLIQKAMSGPCVEDHRQFCEEDEIEGRMENGECRRMRSENMKKMTVMSVRV